MSSQPSTKMHTRLKLITVRELTNGYYNGDVEGDLDAGTVAYGGKLNIRPPYQREFIYPPQKQIEVILSIFDGFPLNVMYWMERGNDTYEILDGQQRTMSICEFVANNLAVDAKFFSAHPSNIRERVLDYELSVYFCKGTEEAVIKSYERINTAGMKLTNQEIRNAAYTGPWLADAKEFFSKKNGGAYILASDYMTGSPIRQEYLEKAIKWITNGKTDEDIRLYMNDNFQKQNANELKQYFKSVFSWVRDTFTTAEDYPKYIKSVEWGKLYNEYKDREVDTQAIATQIEELVLDDDVTNKSGIFAYVLSGDEYHLNIRSFTEAQKQKAYKKQGGKCAITGEEMPIKEMEADHIDPWSKGGKTTDDNCQMISKTANRRKSNK